MPGQTQEARLHADGTVWSHARRKRPAQLALEARGLAHAHAASRLRPIGRPMRAGQFRIPEKRRTRRAVRRDGMGAPSRKTRRWAVIGILLVLVLGAGGAALMLLGGSDLTGAILGSAHEGKTRAELQAELDQEVQDNMMTVSVLPSPRLSASGMLEVGFENDAENKFSQRFTLSQDGVELYRSDPLEPGRRIESIRPKGVSKGKATVEVQAIDQQSGADHGSPTAIEVNVVDNPAETQPAQKSAQDSAQDDAGAAATESAPAA